MLKGCVLGGGGGCLKGVCWEGGGGAKVCGPKMARQDFPDCKFSFFPTIVTLVRGAGAPPLQKKKTS